MEDVVHQNSLIQSTAGAVPVVNDKGEVYMKKVRVQRYISGRRPKYAPDDSEESASSEDDFVTDRQRPSRRADQENAESDDEENADREASGVEDGDGNRSEELSQDVSDPRLLRLQRKKQEARAIQEAGVVEDSDEGHRRRRSSSSSSSSSSGDDIDEDERERRRLLIKQRALQRAREQEEELQKEDNKEGEELQEEESEYEEYSESEEEEQGPRLKPVFVRQKDRITVHEREKQEEQKYRAELERKKQAEDRRRQTLRLVEAEVKREVEDHKEENATSCVGNIEDVNTEDENDEAAYEAWKLRELKRIKREKELRDAMEKEKLEIERLRNMTEDERLRELKNNPKKTVNRASKGKYKFLQKYYHRGAFFVQEKEEDVYKRDFSAPTLEDHFDKSILPKVMQVKNFGRSGRTKYTHLLDQDTTRPESQRTAETAQELKWHVEKAAGTKQVFERPSLRKKT